ncbi:uncharacterized protein LOC122541166 [Chiloscyllium plagiosum]|uniref:uncharacterized protein LOC122541166 n=1 Tax=Chiloscyllium plagiosum TaxID=36176 RepID=UPI001CB85C71|nr:uncharacterized protein LOC122541166 [Chiloscyllium plagiosum]
MNTSPILWILAVFSGIGAETFHVVQKLPRILVEETQSVLIPCKWTGNVSRPIGSYRWQKDGRNGTEVSGQTAEYRGRVHRSQEDFFNSQDASLLLKELKVTDSGMYYCSVKIMELGEEYGAGTQLTVRAKTKGAMTLWSFLLIGALVNGAFLFIFVLYCVKLRRTKGAQWAQRPYRVISEITSVDNFVTLCAQDGAQDLIAKDLHPNNRQLHQPIYITQR